MSALYEVVLNVLYPIVRIFICSGEAPSLMFNGVYHFVAGVLRSVDLESKCPVRSHRACGIKKVHFPCGIIKVHFPCEIIKVHLSAFY